MKKTKILTNDMLVLEKFVDKYGSGQEKDNFIIYVQENYKAEERAYLIRAINMPLKKMIEVLNDYDKSSPKPDEIKLISILAEKYKVTKEDVIKRIQDVRIVKSLLSNKNTITKERKLYLENWLSKTTDIAEINKNFTAKKEIDYLIRAFKMPYKSIVSFLVGVNYPTYDIITTIANLYNVDLGDARIRVNDVLDVVDYIKTSLPDSSNLRKYQKLVRDNIPDIIRNNAEEPITRILNDEEYWHYLCTKVMEELKEVEEAETLEETKKEIADLYEVLLAMIKAKNLTMQDIEETATLKRTKNGGFAKKIFLEKVISKNKQNNS